MRDECAGILRVKCQQTAAYFKAVYTRLGNWGKAQTASGFTQPITEDPCTPQFYSAVTATHPASQRRYVDYAPVR